MSHIWLVTFHVTAIMMHKALLSDRERRQIETYLRQDGDKTENIRQLAYRARTYSARIEADIALVRKLLDRYGKE